MDTSMDEWYAWRRYILDCIGCVKWLPQLARWKYPPEGGTYFRIEKEDTGFVCKLLQMVTRLAINYIIR